LKADGGTGIQRKGAKKQRRQMERQFAGEADGTGDNPMVASKCRTKLVEIVAPFG
jgi:hypothetical protein